MDVFALTMRLKEDGAGAVKASVDKLRDSMNTATTGANKLDNGMKAVSSAMKTLGVAVSIGTAFQKFIDATSEAQFAQAQLKSALGSTGYAAGQSRDALNDHAAALQKVTAFGDDAVNGAQALLLTFTKIRGDVFPKATTAVLDMAQAMGTDLKSAALQVGKALNDPVLGVGALARAGVQFSQQQKDVIESLMKTGQVAKAQEIILKELKTQFGGSAKAARNTLGGALAALKVAFEDLFEASEESTGGIVQGINNITNALISLNEWLTKTQAFTKVFNQIAQSFQVFMAPLMVFKALTGDAASAAKSVNKLNEYLSEFAKNTQLFGQKGPQSSENALQEITVGKSRVALLVELGAVARLSSTELGTLRTAESNLLTQLNAGNVGLEKRIELQKTLVDVQKVTQEQLALGMSKAPTVANPTARQEITGGPAKITAVSPQVIGQVKENFATMNAAIDEQAENTLNNLRTGFAAQLGATFADALGAGFEAAFATGSISKGFKAFGSAMLSGLGGMLQSFGKQALLASTLMTKLMESFGSLNPYVAVAASIALIALGGALKGAASSAFGGGGQSANVSTMGGGYGGGSMRSSAQTLPTLTYGPTSAASGSAIRPASAMNVTIIGPNDPSAQRAMQELIMKADRRGNV
jgi:hypothetical protein